MSGITMRGTKEQLETALKDLVSAHGNVTIRELESILTEKPKVAKEIEVTLLPDPGRYFRDRWGDLTDGLTGDKLEALTNRLIGAMSNHIKSIEDADIVFDAVLGDFSSPRGNLRVV